MRVPQSSLADEDHDSECTGWHKVEGGERRCLACNPEGKDPYGPPPGHVGVWKVDDVVYYDYTEVELFGCECDSSHQTADTVCLWCCYVLGRRRWSDPEPPHPDKALVFPYGIGAGYFAVLDAPEKFNWHNTWTHCVVYREAPDGEQLEEVAHVSFGSAWDAEDAAIALADTLNKWAAQSRAAQARKIATLPSGYQRSSDAAQSAEEKNDV